MRRVGPCRRVAHQLEVHAPDESVAPVSGLVLSGPRPSDGRHRPCVAAGHHVWHVPHWTGVWRFPLTGVFGMSAQVIKLSDHRKMRPAVMPRLMDLSLSIFGANLIIGAAIYDVIIETARQGLKR